MRVVIAEDLFLLRQGLVRLLGAHGFEIVAAVGTAPELLDALISHHPDASIVDVRLPPTHTDDGLRAALQARRQIPGLPVLVLSQYVEQLYARELLADQAGGVGYLLKDRVFDDEQFTSAIRTVASGGTVLDPEVVQKLLIKHALTKPVSRLTTREREVLALMAEGRSNAAIAQRLFITEKAVSKHAAGIFAKLDLAQSDDDNRRVLAVLAYLESLGALCELRFPVRLLLRAGTVEDVDAVIARLAATTSGELRVGAGREPSPRPETRPVLARSEPVPARAHRAAPPPAGNLRTRHHRSNRHTTISNQPSAHP